MRSTLRATVAALVLLLPLVASRSTAAQTTQPASAVGSRADAYGLLVDAELSDLGIPVQAGPVARATQESPPGAAQVATSEVAAAGPIPAGGELVQGVGALRSSARAVGTPLAEATAEVGSVALLTRGGTPLITADVVRARSTTDCTRAPSGAGTELVDLRVDGSGPIPTPEPNTELAPEVFNPLGLRVIANEQHPADGGRGLVVNGIHVYQLSADGPGLFTGDLVVAHAASSVACAGESPGSTGTGDAILITKDADEASAEPGDTITYTATVQNRTNVACPVNRFVDHLPQGLTFVSTAGAFGTSAATEARPGGGIDVVLRPVGIEIPPGGSATQTIVATVADDAASGVAFNDVEVFCADLGSFTMGLGAPVAVQGAEPPASTTTTSTTLLSSTTSSTTAPEGSTTTTTSDGGGAATEPEEDDRQELPRTGGAAPLVAAGAALALAAGLGGLRRRASRP